MVKEIVKSKRSKEETPGERPRHKLVKLTKTKHKKRMLKAAREKQQVTYKGECNCAVV